MPQPVLDLFALFGPVPPRGAEPGVDALKAAHQRLGVAGALTLSTRGIFHSAGAGNRETQKLCAESGGTLVPASVLDPRQPRADTLVSGGRALALFPATQGWPIAFAPLRTALKNLASRNVAVPLLFESRRIGDATAMASVLQESGYGGPVVFFSVSGDEFSEVLAVSGDNPRYFVATDKLIGVGEIALAVEILGADRVVFASGAIARGSLSSALAVVNAAGLSDVDAAKVLNLNTRKLLSGGPIG